MRTTTKRTDAAAKPLPRVQANRLGRGRVRVIDDPDAPGNWWVYDARNPYRGESHAPMTREAFAALVKQW